MVLVDDNRFFRNVDALLRADGIAQLAADAAVTYIVAWCFLCLLADGEAVPNDVCWITDVKILAVRFVQAEHL